MRAAARAGALQLSQTVTAEKSTDAMKITGWKKTSASIFDSPLRKLLVSTVGISTKETAVASRIPIGIPMQAKCTAWLRTSFLIWDGEVPIVLSRP